MYDQYKYFDSYVDSYIVIPNDMSKGGGWAPLPKSLCILCIVYGVGYIRTVFVSSSPPDLAANGIHLVFAARSHRERSPGLERYFT